LVPHARVGAFAGTTLVAKGAADDLGVFTLAGLSAGDVTIAAVDPATNGLGQAQATLAEGALTALGDVVILDPARAGSVKVDATASDGGSLAGQTIDVLTEAFGTFWKGVIALDAAGHGAYSPVPPGRVFLRWSVGPAVSESEHQDLAEGGQVSFAVV